MNNNQLIIRELASYIRDQDVVSTGVASLLPLQAIRTARKSHAPNLAYLNCIGAIDPDLDVEPFTTSEDPRLLNSYKSFITLPELFDLGVKGEIDVMFFGGSQIDQHGNLNLTCIGDYHKPKVKLPGPAGSTPMLKKVKRPVLFTMNHSVRTFVPQVDFITSQSVQGTTREQVPCVTNLGVLIFTPDGVSLAKVFPWSSEQDIRANTGFEITEKAEL